MQMNHQDKRSQLSGVGVALLALGVPLLVFGLFSFGSTFFTSSDEFFHDPHGVIERFSRAGFIGILCIGLGGLLTGGGVRLLFFSHAGAIARFAAGELTPVMREVGTDLAPTFGEIARQVRGDGGVRCSACGTSNDATASFCDECGTKLGKACLDCGARLAVDASFCDRCGTAFA
jgi:ribosomal protein L40E